MKLYLKTGKDRSIRMGSPWIFSGAVAFVRGEPDEHNLCGVYDNRGVFLGVGYYNKKSAICVRMLKFVRQDPPSGLIDAADSQARVRARELYIGAKSDDDDWDDETRPNAEATDDAAPKSAASWNMYPHTPASDDTPVTFTADDLRERIRDAVDRRGCGGILADDTDCCRLVNAEGDFLPGLTVDRYGAGVCLQIGTAGMEVWRDEIVSALNDTMQPDFIYERSDTDSRRREGLEDCDGIVKGTLPESLVIMENGVKFHINLHGGQKTGFFLDQRENRALLRRYSAGRSVCDCFSYSGGFALNAALGGASSVRAIDSSAAAGQILAANALLNGADIQFTEADVFAYLREPQPETDMIILDPPKFARHAGEADKAARGYKDINLSAMRMLASGGILFTFSCSGAVSPYLFRQIVYSAAADAQREVQVLHILTAGSDHPVNIAHKEGEYLKGLVLRVL